MSIPFVVEKSTYEENNTQLADHHCNYRGHKQTPGPSFSTKTLKHCTLLAPRKCETNTTFATHLKTLTHKTQQNQSDVFLVCQVFCKMNRFVHDRIECQISLKNPQTQPCQKYLRERPAHTTTMVPFLVPVVVAPLATPRENPTTTRHVLISVFALREAVCAPDRLDKTRRATEYFDNTFGSDATKD